MDLILSNIEKNVVFMEYRENPRYQLPRSFSSKKVNPFSSQKDERDIEIRDFSKSVDEVLTPFSR
jgi:hypothetical protein